MREIAPDILHSAYTAVAESGAKLTGAKREVVVLMASQLVAAERDRCAHHISTARYDFLNLGDGNPVIRRAVEIVDAALRAIREGAE